MKGLEPSTTASTVQRSTIELHPPRENNSIIKGFRLQAACVCDLLLLPAPHYSGLLTLNP